MLRGFHKLVMDNSTYIDAERVLQEMDNHMKYKTCVVLLDENKMVYAFCRWNILNKETAHIIDLVIRSDFRNKGAIFDITKKGLIVWPELKWLVFERGYDDGTTDKKLHKISIEGFLRRERK